MKKYILIQNDGEIETNSFELIGASTKRGEAGKIGFFGSGLKYSIAYMMRSNIDFRVFSGNQELKFTTVPETLKDQSFDRICINDKPTSYTVTMGPTWKEDWFVLREIYCNAVDEGSCQMVKSTDIVEASSGNTRIFIELTPALSEVIEHWDKYFADEREPLFVTSEVYTCALGLHDGSKTNQKVTVFSKTDGVLYRRGIRVYSNKHFQYDYLLQGIDVNEDRTAKNISSLPYMFTDMMGRFVNEEWVKNILRSGTNDRVSEEYHGLNYAEDNFSDEWVKFSEDYLLVVREISGRYAEEMRETKRESFLIPGSFARKLKKHQPQVRILGMGKMIGDYGAEEVASTPKIDFLLKEVRSSLKEMKYDFDYDISIVQFEKDEVKGAADIKNKKILLSKDLYDEGRREIALTIIEEVEHIRSGAADETRAFQSHLISEWLTSMENQNGLFL